MATATRTHLDLVGQQDRVVRAYLAMLEQGGRPSDIGVGAVDVEQALAGYAQRYGISYGAWREIGVPDIVLRKAGITPREDR